ncbi:hypothetical protein [Streptomyces sp. ISL-98]|uniref:hypothetical protein n=1 Tax=Streptomyces sp. ISL-98 TaxID=2819192 RepID=UPI001BE6B3A6|nr:hypothetical protein [Streptomyces sp. ISL-98]
MALHAVFAGDVETATELGVEDLAKPNTGRGLAVSLIHRDLDKPVIDREPATLPAGLYGGADMPGAAVPLTVQGEEFRDQAHALFEKSFDDFSRSVRMGDEAERKSGPEAEALAEQAALLIEEAELDGKRGMLLLDQGQWYDEQAPTVLSRLYAENSEEAAKSLAAEFANRWGRPLIPEHEAQLPAAAEQIQGEVWVVTSLPGSTNPGEVIIPAPAAASAPAAPRDATTAAVPEAEEAEEAEASGEEEAAEWPTMRRMRRALRRHRPCSTAWRTGRPPSRPQSPG